MIHKCDFYPYLRHFLIWILVDFKLYFLWFRERELKPKFYKMHNFEIVSTFIQQYLLSNTCAPHSSETEIPAHTNLSFFLQNSVSISFTGR